MENTVQFYIGGEDFQELIEGGYYYIDKTSYLKEIFMGQTNAKAPFFLRPRRFGKTLNMNMIKSFCELNYENPGDKSYQEKLFLDNGRGLAVAKYEYKELRDRFMGEFPVIYISFKGIEGNSYIYALGSLLKSIGAIYKKFLFLTDSTKILPSERDAFLRIVDFCRQESVDLYQRNILFKAEMIASDFISNLASLLYQEFARKVIVIIDEYDVPLQKAAVAETPYYNKIVIAQLPPIFENLGEKVRGI